MTRASVEVDQADAPATHLIRPVLHWIAGQLSRIAPHSHAGCRDLIAGILSTALLGASWFLNEMAQDLGHLRPTPAFLVACCAQVVGVLGLIGVWSRSDEIEGSIAWRDIRWAAFVTAAGSTVFTAWIVGWAGALNLHLLHVLAALSCWTVTGIQRRDPDRQEFLSLGQAACAASLVFGLVFFQAPYPPPRSDPVNATANAPPNRTDQRLASAAPARMLLNPRSDTPFQASVDDVVGQQRHLGAPSRSLTPISPTRLTLPPQTQCERFAREVEQALIGHDIGPLSARLNAERFAQRAASGLGFEADVIRGEAQVLGRSWSAALGKAVVEARAHDGVRLLHVSDVDTERRALFRFLYPDGSFNYIGFVLAAEPDDTLTVIDAYDYASGELLSVMMKRTVVPTLFAQAAGGPDHLPASARAWAANASRLREFLAQVNPGTFDARGAFDRLPPALRGEKVINLLYLQAAGTAGSTTFKRALKQYQQTFPDDPGIDMWLIDLHQQEKNYGLLLDALWRLRTKIGADPYLESRRAEAYLHVDSQQAELIASGAVATEPTLEEPYWTLIRLSLTRRRFYDTVSLLTSMKKNVGCDPPDITGLPELSDFVASMQYQTWSANQSETPATSSAVNPNAAPEGTQLDPNATLRQTRESILAAEQACLQKLSQSAPYHTAKAAVDEAKRRLDEARAKGTDEQRRNASLAYLRAAAAIKELERNATATDASVRAAKTAEQNALSARWVD